MTSLLATINYLNRVESFWSFSKIYRSGSPVKERLFYSSSAPEDF